MNATLDALQEGLVLARQHLWQAAWSPDWETARPKVVHVRAELASALIILAIDGMPDNYDTALSYLTETQRIGLVCQRAADMLSQAIAAADENPTLRARALVSAAIQELDGVIQ